MAESEEEEFEEEIQEERFYVVPLAKKGFEKAPRWKAAKKAIKVLQKFLTRHMKPEGPVYISPEINERIWENGIKNPPRKIRVRVTKSVDGIVRAYLA
ncbi:MAG: 50S ribosomal protein L31e [Promethearchaeota archaeon]